jgi:hypothetical protein
MHGDGAGLCLCVGAGGARSWISRYMLNRRAREMGIGPVHTMSLAEARSRAQQCRQQPYDVINPIEPAKRSSPAHSSSPAKAMTFAECAQACIAAHQAGWRNPKHAAHWP